MSIRRQLVVAGALALLAASGTNALALSDGVAINIVDEPRPQSKWGYAPATRKIDPGTWVTWSNNGQDPHTVTADDGSFDSGNLDPSEGFSWYFDTPGTFTYACSFHAWMTGEIIVGAASDTPPAPPADSAP
jgi:plastocyanin